MPVLPKNLKSIHITGRKSIFKSAQVSVTNHLTNQDFQDLGTLFKKCPENRKSVPKRLLPTVSRLKSNPKYIIGIPGSQVTVCWALIYSTLNFQYCTIYVKIITY